PTQRRGLVQDRAETTPKELQMDEQPAIDFGTRTPGQSAERRRRYIGRQDAAVWFPPDGGAPGGSARRSARSSCSPKTCIPGSWPTVPANCLPISLDWLSGAPVPVS